MKLKSALLGAAACLVLAANFAVTTPVLKHFGGFGSAWWLTFTTLNGVALLAMFAVFLVAAFGLHPGAAGARFTDQLSLAQQVRRDQS